MVKKMLRLGDKMKLRSRTFSWLQIMTWLQVDAHSHRRVYRDGRQAYAMMALFFPQLLETNIRSLFEDSQLTNQQERAQHPPDRRSYHSNRYRYREFWNDLDALVDRDSRTSTIYFDLKKYPSHWNNAVRPIIAKCKLLFPILANCSHEPFNSVQGRCHPELILCRVKRPGHCRERTWARIRPLL